MLMEKRRDGRRALAPKLLFKCKVVGNTDNIDWFCLCVSSHVTFAFCFLWPRSLPMLWIRHVASIASLPTGRKAQWWWTKWKLRQQKKTLWWTGVCQARPSACHQIANRSACIARFVVQFFVPKVYLQSAEKKTNSENELKHNRKINAPEKKKKKREHRRKRMDPTNRMERRIWSERFVDGELIELSSFSSKDENWHREEEEDTKEGAETQMDEECIKYRMDG